MSSPDLNPTPDLSGLRVCQFCWLPGTNSDGLREATTTHIARTTKSLGWTGRAWTRTSLPSLARSLSCGSPTQCFTVPIGFRGAQVMASASRIAHGSSPRARRCWGRTGKWATLGRWGSSSTALSLDSTNAANGSLLGWQARGNRSDAVANHVTGTPVACYIAKLILTTKVLDSVPLGGIYRTAHVWAPL